MSALDRKDVFIDDERKVPFPKPPNRNGEWSTTNGVAAGPVRLATDVEADEDLGLRERCVSTRTVRSACVWSRLRLWTEAFWGDDARIKEPFPSP